MLAPQCGMPAAVLSTTVVVFVLKTNQLSSAYFAASRARYASGPVVAQPALTGLTAAGDQVRSFSWSIATAADDSDIVDDQENHNLHYTIKVTRDHGSISAARVAGSFSIFNPNAASLTLSSVSAELSDRKNTYSCSVSMPSSLVLAAETRVEARYECNLGSVSAEGLTLVAAMAWPKQKVDGVAMAAGSDKAQLHITYSHMSETLVSKVGRMFGSSYDGIHSSAWDGILAIM